MNTPETINIEKYAEALNNLIGVDSAYMTGDKDVDAIVEVIVAAKKLENRVKELKAEKDALIKNYAEYMKDYAREIFDEIEKVFEPSVSALFLTSETLVDVSKSHIDADRAIIDIRKYLSKAICSRYQLKKALEEPKKKYIGENDNE